MISISLLFKSVLSLLFLMVPGILIEKFGLISERFRKDISKILLYIGTPAMVLSPFFREFDKGVLWSVIAVFSFSIALHGVMYAISCLCFKRAPESVRAVYRFAAVFANSGYMGIPLIIAVLGADYAIYASVYLIPFNMFLWTFGVLIFTKDKKALSPRHFVFNPSSVAAIVGIIVFVSDIAGHLPSIIPETASSLGSIVPPLSMMLIGIQLAHIKFDKTLFSFNMLFCMLLRLIILPACAFAVMKLVSLAGIYNNEKICYVVMICISAPCAAATGMFAELYDKDSLASGKTVTLSSLLCCITMPLIVMLMKLY